MVFVEQSADGDLLVWSAGLDLQLCGAAAMTVLVLIFFTALFGGFIGAYIGVLAAWWRIKGEVIGRLGLRAVQEGTTGL